MKSNNQKIVIILLLVSTFLIPDVSAIIIDSPYLRVIAEEVSPEPVEPGQDITVKIRLINEGAETAEDVSLKLNVDYPFFVKTESNNFKKKISLCGRCSIDNTYYLIVDGNAKSGIYPLDFEIYMNDFIIEPPNNTIYIKVIGKPDIILETQTLIANVSSGDKFTINFEVRNIGTGIARNIKITPQSDKIFMLGSNINLINEINPDKTVSFSSEFIIKESLVPDTYKFPVRLAYIDEQGSSYETGFDIGVNVLERADINLQSIKVTPAYPTFADEIHMEGIIENVGRGSANKVTVELITPEGKKLRAFIGQLEADNDAPFYFDAKPESVGMQTATINVSYYDDFGFHSYETTIEKEVRKPTNNVIIIIIILLVALVGIGYFYYKKKKTKKH